MNSISPVPPVIGILPGEAIEVPERVEPDTRPLEEQSLPEGVALLLAILEPSLRGARRSLALPTAVAGQHVSLGARADAPGAADAPLPPRDIVLPGTGLSGAERGAAGIGATFRDGLDAQAQGGAAEELPSACIEENRGLADVAQESPALRGGGEFALDSAQARLESAVALVPASFEGMAEESAAMPEWHEEAFSESAEPDEEAEASDTFLQVPFSNGRARGQVLISRDGPGKSGLLIRPSDRQVYEQLEGHFEQARQPRWRLGEVPGSDGGRPV